MWNWRWMSWQWPWGGKLGGAVRVYRSPSVFGKKRPQGSEMWHRTGMKWGSSIQRRMVAVSKLRIQQQGESLKIPAGHGGWAWGQELASWGAKQLNICWMDQQWVLWTGSHSAVLIKAEDFISKWVIWIILLGYYSVTFPVSLESRLLRTLCLVPRSSQKKKSKQNIQLSQKIAEKSISSFI